SLLPVIFIPTRFPSPTILPHDALSRMRAAGGLRGQAPAEAHKPAHQILPLDAVDADTDDDGAALKQELDADPRIGRQDQLLQLREEQGRDRRCSEVSDATKQ